MDTPQQKISGFAAPPGDHFARQDVSTDEAANNDASVVDEEPEPNFELELRATALGTSPPASPSPASAAARVEFDQLIQALCSAEPPHSGHKTWAAGYVRYRAAKTASDILARYQLLRLALSPPDNSEYWQGARDGLLALKAGNSRLASSIVASLSLQTSKSSSLARVILGIVW